MSLENILSLGQTLSTFHYTLLDKCRALLSVVERGWPNALNFSLDLELNIPRMYYLINNSFMACFVHYLMNSNCTCVRSTTLDNFALDQTSLDKKQSSRLHSTRWPNPLDISLNMHVERCIVKSRERLARALEPILLICLVSYTMKKRTNDAIVTAFDSMGRYRAKLYRFLQIHSELLT